MSRVAGFFIILFCTVLSPLLVKSMAGRVETVDLEWQLPVHWSDIRESSIRFRAQASQNQNYHQPQQGGAFSGKVIITGRVGQMFVVCAKNVVSDDFVYTSTVVDRDRLHTLTLVKNTGLLSIYDGKACPDELARHYPYAMAQMVRSNEPFPAIRKAVKKANKKEKPRNHPDNDDSPISVLPSAPNMPDALWVARAGAESGFDGYNDFRRPPFMPAPDKAMASLILLPTLNLPANWRNLLFSAGIPFTGLYHWLTDQSETQAGLTLLVQFDGRPPIMLRISQTEYPEMAEHLLNVRRLLYWLAPKLNGREAFIQQLLDVADNIVATSPFWDEETLHEFQQQLMIVLEQPDTEFSLEFETHRSGQTFLSAAANKGQIKYPGTPEPNPGINSLGDAGATKPSEPGSVTTELFHSAPDKEGKQQKGQAPSRPPTGRVSPSEASAISGDFFTITVGGKRFLIDKKQLDPAMGGNEDPATIAAFAEGSPEQSYLLTELEKAVLKEREKVKSANPKGSQEGVINWLADDSECTALNYLYVYGDAATKKQLWYFYPVYTLTLPISEDYSPPPPFPGKADDDQICSICLDFFIRRSEAVQTPCGHLYCAHCLKGALTSQTTCPICRQIVELPSPLTINGQFLKAAEMGDRQGLSLLLGLGADINRQDGKGNTALHLAYRYQCSQVVGFLLSKGAHKDTKNNAGRRPIDLAPAAQQESLTLQAELLEQQLSLFEQIALGSVRQLEAFLAQGGDSNQQHPENLSTLLHFAVEHSQYELVDRLQQCPNIQVDKANELGNTPLMVAAGKGYEVMVVKLLERGASRQQVNKDGMSPLMFAAQNGHLAVVNQLIETLSPEAVAVMTEQADLNGRTALILATQNKHDQVIQFLLDRGVNIHHQDDFDMNPLMYAVHQGNLPLTRLLTRLGATAKNKGELGIDAENDHGCTALENAAAASDIEIIKCLLEAGANLRYALIQAAGAGRLEVVQWLVQQGADINKANKDGGTPLLMAVDAGHIELAQWLVQQGADIYAVHKYGKSPLILAVEFGFFELARWFVNWLVQQGADFHTVTRGLLHWAVDSGRFDFVQWLVQKGVDINYADQQGYTPLHMSVYAEELHIAQWLVQQGADINMAGVGGASPLSIAVLFDQKEFVKWLVQQGADVDIVDENEDTPLVIAVHNGYLELAEYLVQQGADMNKAAPLHRAMMRGYPNFAKWLAQQGADIHAADEFGNTPLWSALEYGHPELAKWLVQQGADINLLRVGKFLPLGKRLYAQLSLSEK